MSEAHPGEVVWDDFAQERAKRVTLASLRAIAAEVIQEIEEGGWHDEDQSERVEAIRAVLDDARKLWSGDE